jgi:hypothetical protein
MQRAHIRCKNAMHNYILMTSDTNLSSSGQQSKLIGAHKTREPDTADVNGSSRTIP